MSIEPAIWSVAICAAVLTIYYGLSSPWWRRWSGWAIFTLGAVIMIWFWIGVALKRGWLSVSPPVNLILSYAIATLIDFALISLLVSNICARSRDRRARRRRNREKSPR